VDNGVLDAVRAWLEPMYPSKALPAVGIQKAFFEVLPKVSTMIQSGIGLIYASYSITSFLLSREPFYLHNRAFTVLFSPLNVLFLLNPYPLAILLLFSLLSPPSSDSLPSQMDLDTQTLKECRLGPIILFYTKTKRVTPAINRQADSLVQAWSRPIIKRPANFRSRRVDTQADVARNNERDGSGDVDMDGEGGARGMGGEVVKRKKRFDVGQALKENEGRKGARLYIARVGYGLHGLVGIYLMLL
jgi:hypothetical protein